MSKFIVQSSDKVTEKNCKIMFWGKQGSRKTESILRNFPRVLIIDTEGNTDQCVGMKEIPTFLRVVTKDSRDVMEIIDQVAAGTMKFPDGAPVETLAIDSASVLWSVQQEVAAVNAENRAVKYGRPADSANMTQLDWVLAKRPMKRIANRINGTPVKYFIVTAREKDLYEETTGASDTISKKIGVTPDVMKGFEHELNLILHLGFEGKEWVAEVTKTQGLLGTLFPMGSKLREIPIKELEAYSKGRVSKKTAGKDEDEIAREIASTEGSKHTQAELIKFAADNGVSAADLGKALKEAGFKAFDPTKWEEMKTAVAAANFVEVR